MWFRCHTNVDPNIAMDGRQAQLLQWQRNQFVASSFQETHSVLDTYIISID